MVRQSEFNSMILDQRKIGIVDLIGPGFFDEIDQLDSANRKAEAEKSDQEDSSGSNQSSSKKQESEKAAKKIVEIDSMITNRIERSFRNRVERIQGNSF